MAEQQKRPSGILARLIGGKALEEREAATTRRLDAEERLRALCDGAPKPPEPSTINAAPKK